MKARIVITQDGQIGLYTEEGTFEQGVEKLAALLAALQAQGVQLVEVGEPEQHRHDGEHVHAHTHTEA